MMTLAQIVKVIRCSNNTAMTRLEEAKIPVESRNVSKTGGRKFYYDITPEQVLELKKKKTKDPQQAIAEQGCALVALEMAFNSRRSMELGNYIKAD